MNGSQDGLIASQNDGTGIDREMREHEGVRHSLGSPEQDGYKLAKKKNPFISFGRAWRERERDF